MASPVVLDAGPLVTILNRDDEFHRWAVAQLHEISSEIITCEPVISETFFLVRHVPGAVSTLLSLLEARAVVLRFDLAEQLRSIAALVRKYHDIPMTIADACLVRMSELHDSSRVFTLDADFKIYRRHSRQAIPLIFPAP